MADESKQHQQLHVAMFPWLAFGHMIPYLELAKLIARKGHHISFISTPKNIQRLLLNNTKLSENIHFVTFPLPPTPNLPENIESTMEAPPHTLPFLKLAYDALQQPLSGFLQTTTPDWIIYDFAPYWLPEIAAHYGVSRAFFCSITVYTLSFFGSTTHLIHGDDPRGDSLEKYTVVPDWIPFQTTAIYELHEIRKLLAFLREIPMGHVSDLFRTGLAIEGCDVYLTRSTDELESHWLDMIRELYQRPVIPVGLMPTMAVKEEDTDDSTWVEIRTWLDKHATELVVFVALGSESTLTREELTELAEGLQLSGSPYLWLLRQSGELPEGFQDRVKGKGFVCTSWAPQLKILSHKSVGGFLTHCGSSSVTEALGFGLPLIMLPLFGDQPLIARIMKDELKVGVEIKRVGSEAALIRNSVAESVKSVMNGEEGRGYREKAKEAQKIYGSKELQEKYTNNFVKYLLEHRPQNHGITII